MANTNLYTEDKLQLRQGQSLRNNENRYYEPYVLDAPILKQEKAPEQTTTHNLATHIEANSIKFPPLNLVRYYLNKQYNGRITHKRQHD